MISMLSLTTPNEEALFWLPQLLYIMDSSSVPAVPPGHTCLSVYSAVLMLSNWLVHYHDIMAWLLSRVTTSLHSSLSIVLDLLDRSPLAVPAVILRLRWKSSIRGSFLMFLLASFLVVVLQNEFHDACPGQTKMNTESI